MKNSRNLDLQDKKILIPGSAISRDELRNGLNELGADVNFIPVYDVDVPKKEEVTGGFFNLEELNLLAFTSPSAFRNFLEIFEIKNIKDFFDEKVIAAIGPTTEAVIAENGLETKIVPEEFTIQGLEKAIVIYYTKN